MGNCRNKQLHLYDNTIVIEQYIPVKFGNIKLSAPLSNSNNKLWKMWFCFNVQVNIKIDKLNLKVKSFSVSTHVSYCCIRSGVLLKLWNMFFLSTEMQISTGSWIAKMLGVVWKVYKPSLWSTICDRHELRLVDIIAQRTNFLLSRYSA